MGDHSHHGHGGGHGAHDHAGHAGMMDMTTSSSTPSPATIIGGDHSDHAGHHMDHGSGHGDGGTMGHGMMHMYFHGGVNETILFEFWKTSDTWGLILSMLLIFLLAFAYEGLKFYREHLYRHSFQTVQLSTVAVPVENGTMRETHKTVQVKILSMMHCWQTVLHIFQMIISYFLMLIFMTYNVWLCLAVAVGAGAGYFCFGWKKSVVVDVTEHCH